jgi:hydrogenase maturation protease
MTKKQMNKTNNILIVGVGNTLMGDDGIGAYVAARLEALQLQGVRTVTVQQITSDLLDEMLPADYTVIVDARVEAEPVQFYPVTITDTTGSPQSHHASAPLLIQLAKLVYEKELSVMVCAVGAWDLNLEEKLSRRGKKNADQAVSTILGWINGL